MAAASFAYLLAPIKLWERLVYASTAVGLLMWLFSNNYLVPIVSALVFAVLMAVQWRRKRILSPTPVTPTVEAGKA